MFVGFSKTIAKFGGFRLGIGIRMNKKNAFWISLIIMFVAMFKLMWYMMILCGWLFYAICYGIIWCIKRIIKSSRKKQSINKAYNVSKQSTDRPVVEEDVLIVPNEIQKHLDEKSNQSELSQDQEHENTQQTVQKASNHSDDEDVLVVPNDIKVHIQKNSDKKTEDQPPQKKPSVTRWIIGGIFAIFAFVNGLHFSSLLLLGAAFLMFPLPFANSFCLTKNIKPIVAIILSIALFLAGMLTSAPSEAINSSSDNITQTTSSNEEKDSSAKPNNSTTKPDNSTFAPSGSTSSNSETTAPNNTTNNDEKAKMVWVSSSGTKYHSRSSCSNMNSPKQISLEDAKKQGYTACKKCH